MRRTLAYLLGLLALSSCIRNDLPYPVLVAEVTSMEVEGALGVSISPEKRSISIELPEAAEIGRVHVTGVEYRHANTKSEPELLAVHDLSSPKTFTLSTYQDYEWTVSAVQNIERYFTVRGQMGAAVIDEPNRRAVVTVSGSEDKTDIKVTSLKLGPAGISTYSPAMEDIHDFTDGVEVKVNFSGKSETWSLYVEQTDVSVEVTSLDAWTRCAWISANGVEGKASGFEYRLSGTSEWIPVPDVKVSGGTFTACIDGLEPETSYECRAFCGEDFTTSQEFATEAEEQLPNAGFEAYSHAESSVYYSWFDPSALSLYLQSKWWDSGNVGSTTVGSAYCIAIPDTENKVEGSTSASLVSRNVVIKFAAGNTFSGEFAGLVGTQGGLVNFGRPWTLRPRAIRLWARYDCGSIDVVDSYPTERPVKVGDPDMCSMMVALGDWDYRRFGGTPQCPVQVNTTDKSTFFDPSTSSVIAYGSFTSDKSSTWWEDCPEFVQDAGDGWVELEIPLEYRATDRRPTHIIVSFASSALGDYFTGSSQSRMWIDDIRLVY